MFVIKDAQLMELNIVPLQIFLNKVEVFVRDNLSDDLVGNIDLPGYIKEMYFSAKKNNLESEQDIVKYIVEVILKTTA